MKYLGALGAWLLLFPCVLFGQDAVPAAPQTPTGYSALASPTPTGISIASGEAQKPFVPVPGEKVKLEDWITHPASVTVRAEENRTKPGVWLSLISLGAGFPQDANLQTAYNTSFHFGLGMGLRVSAPLSLWLDFSLDQFNNKNSNLTHDNNYMLIGLGGLARYRFLSSDFSPFVFLGPGLAYNENRSTVPVVDTTLNTVTVPINGYEFDFLMEGGIGGSYEALNGLEVFLQGRILWDLTSPHFAGIGYTDSPVRLIPVEAGVLFSY